VWSGRGQSILIMPADSEPVLVVDSAEHRTHLVAALDVRADINIPALVGQVLREPGLASAALGLIARESLH
jgi:hypothetical protein